MAVGGILAHGKSIRFGLLHHGQRILLDNVEIQLHLLLLRQQLQLLAVVRLQRILCEQKWKK